MIIKYQNEHKINFFRIRNKLETIFLYGFFVCGISFGFFILLVLCKKPFNRLTKCKTNF